MTVTEGFFDYTGKQWTTHQSALLALYYLAITANLLSPVIKPSNSNEFYIDIRKLAPTYHIDDPADPILAKSYANLSNIVKQQKSENQE